MVPTLCRIVAIVGVLSACAEPDETSGRDEPVGPASPTADTLDPSPREPIVPGPVARLDPRLDSSLEQARFGRAVAVDGNTALVAANGSSGRGAQRGAVHVYQLQGDQWRSVATLFASDDGESFGASLAVDGDTAVVGAPLRDNGGAVYVFQRTAGQWTEVAIVEPTSGQAGDLFGAAVAIDDNGILVGEPGRLDGTGAAWAFAKIEGRWQRNRQYTDASLAPGDRFGAAVALRGELAAIGAPGSDVAADNAGLVYLFSDAQRVATCAAVPAAAGESLGTALDFADTSLVAGAPGTQSSSPGGSVHIFRQPETGTECRHESRLTAANTAAFGHSLAAEGEHLLVGALATDGQTPPLDLAIAFRQRNGRWQDHGAVRPDYRRAPWQAAIAATSLALSGDRALLGSPEHDTFGDATGRVFTLRRASEGWQLGSDLSMRESAGLDGFGETVALHQDTLAVGAPTDSTAGNRAGSVTLFRRTGDGWIFDQKLAPPTPSPGGGFGTSLAVDSNTLVVGEWVTSPAGRDTRALRIYHRDGDAWVLTTTLTDEDSGGSFGTAIALVADTLVVGAHAANRGRGRVLVYRRVGDTWRQLAALEPGEQSGASTGFGQAVAFDGSAIAVGAPLDDAQRAYGGAVFVFSPNGDGWKARERLESPTDAMYFGRGVALEAGTLVAAAGTRAFAFARGKTGWAVTKTFARALGESVYSGALSLSGSVLLLGATEDRSHYPSSVDLFERFGARWRFAGRVFAPHKEQSHDAFGAALQVDGRRVVVGSPRAAGPNGMWFTGSAHAFEF